MDQREHQLQSLSICHRLYNFIMKSLASQALKIVTLGPPMTPAGLPQVPISSAARDGAGSKSDHPMAQGRPCEDVLSGAKVELEQGNASKNLEPFGPHGRELPPVQDDDSNMSSGKRSEEGVLSTTAQQPKAPKKMVSINDVLEEISTTKKNKKMSKATKKSTSLDCEEDDPKPLRSILKVGSKLNEKSDSFVNRSSDG